MAQKSYDERLADIRKKREQLIAQHTAQERKKRTRRLIELGGIIESVLGRETTDDDKKRLLNFLKKQEMNGKFFTKAMNFNDSQEETSLF